MICTPCNRRSVMTSGWAPPSLMEIRKPPGEVQSTNSWITASQTFQKPSETVLTSTL